MRVTGEDPITINRKFLAAVTGPMPLRVVMMANELPEFIDPTGSFVSRFQLYRFRQSFYSREDPLLTHRLMSERSGILNWALEGLGRLQQRGRFTQPRTSAEELQHLEDLAKPLGAFVRTRCVLEPTSTVETQDLFKAWKDWAAEQEIGGPTSNVDFGRKLRKEGLGIGEGKGELARDPQGQVLRTLHGRSYPRPRHYTGIRLKNRDELADEEECE